MPTIFIYSSNKLPVRGQGNLMLNFNILAYSKKHSTLTLEHSTLHMFYYVHDILFSVLKELTFYNFLGFKKIVCNLQLILLQPKYLNYGYN